MSAGAPAVHVAGVAGVGMSALAQVLLGAGYRVSGSDRFLDQGRRLPVLDTLAAAGVVLCPQDGEVLCADTRALVVSTAIEDDNPDVLRARALGVPVMHRAEMLARLSAYRNVVAVTGTAGKSTITAMIGWILEQAGRDPTVVNGGEVPAWQAPGRVGNVRMGGSELWVLEADESDRSLLWFHPDAAVLSNVAKDHFELEEVAELFHEFCGQVRGPVLCGPGVGDLIRHADLEEVHGAIEGDNGRWVLTLDGCRYGVSLLGRHNAENAMLAVAMCRRLGVEPGAIAEALPRFGGVARRLQQVGGAAGIRVVDDYAHNPMKLAAAWRAVREEGRRVVGIWRPHGFAPLELMFEDFVAALAASVRSPDRLYLLPVFYAGGTARGARSSGDLVRALRREGIDAREAADYEPLAEDLLGEGALAPGDTVLVMGARDPGLPAFARELAARLATRRAESTR
jgi:UDP-N-acetylmuramate-alanine ligase